MVYARQKVIYAKECVRLPEVLGIETFMDPNYNESQIMSDDSIYTHVKDTYCQKASSKLDYLNGV